MKREDILPFVGKPVRIETAFAGVSGSYTGRLERVLSPGKDGGKGELVELLCLEEKRLGAHVGYAVRVSSAYPDGTSRTIAEARFRRKDGREVGSAGFTPVWTGPIRAVVSIETLCL